MSMSRINYYFYKSVKYGLNDKVKYLLTKSKSKININMKDNFGYTALMYASKYSNHSGSKMFDNLINKGADVNARNKFDETALMLAVKRSNSTSNISTINKLINNCENINDKDIHGNTALMLAISKNTIDINTINILIEKGKVDVNAKDTFGNTALMIASKFLNSIDIEKVIDYLLNNGANIDEKNIYGETALMMLVKKKQDYHVLKKIDYLINKGADVNEKDNYGHSVLMNAVLSKENNFYSIKKLLDNKENYLMINDTDYEKNTALTLIALYQLNIPKTVKLLINYGADLCIINNNGETAFSLASGKPEFQYTEKYKRRYWMQLY